MGRRKTNSGDADGASSSSSSEDEDEVKRRLAMSSCVVSTSEVLESAAAAAKKPKRRQPSNEAPDSDGRGGGEPSAPTSACDSLPAHRPILQKLSTERLNEVISLTLEVAENVWPLRKRQKGCTLVGMCIFARSSTHQPTDWPPSTTGAGCYSAHTLTEGARGADPSRSVLELAKQVQDATRRSAKAAERKDDEILRLTSHVALLQAQITQLTKVIQDAKLAVPRLAAETSAAGGQVHESVLDSGDRAELKAARKAQRKLERKESRRAARKASEDSQQDTTG
jgi:hypothetical protein